MDATVHLPIPGSLTTRFLVATDERVTPGTGHLRDVLGAGGLSGIARDLLGSPMLVVGEADAACSGRLAGMGGGAAELLVARSARRHLVVTCTAAPAAQPRHAQAARLVARVLGRLTRGVVADLAANQLISPAAVEAERFILGEDWLGVFVCMDDEQSVRVDTVGLHRFGLPELVARQVSYGEMLTAGNVLRALAFRMLTEHWAWLAGNPGAGVRRIPGSRELDLNDVLCYWGVTPKRPGEVVPVELTPEPAHCPECAAGLRVKMRCRRPPGWAP